MSEKITPAAIAEILHGCGMTQADLAHELEVTPVTVWRWASGRAAPTNRAKIERIRALLKAARQTEQNGANDDDA